MKSTDGQHFVGLDQVRGLAAFLVFVWHFLCAFGPPAPFPGARDFFANSIIAEGHTGVAIFMVLSGYLFARLTEGKKLLIAPFLYNRFMRLAPLMIAVILVRLGMAAWDGFPVFQKQLKNAFLGVALPTWPNGGWSITAEMH